MSKIKDAAIAKFMGLSAQGKGWVDLEDGHSFFLFLDYETDLNRLLNVLNKISATLSCKSIMTNGRFTATCELQILLKEGLSKTDYKSISIHKKRKNLKLALYCAIYEFIVWYNKQNK